MTAERVQTLSAPPMPKEHGVWGMLLVPFFTAAGACGVFDLKLLLLLISILCFYIARASYLKRRVGWTVALLIASAACALPLMIVWRLWWLAAFGVVGALVSFRPTARSLALEILAIISLTMTAPAAWYTAKGGFSSEAFLLWGLNALFFPSSVFFVRMWRNAAMSGQPPTTLRDRLRLASQSLCYHGALALALAALAIAVIIPWFGALAFAPVLVRAAGGVWWLSDKMPIRRIGWAEVAYSVFFGATLIVALRFFQ